MEKAEECLVTILFLYIIHKYCVLLLRLIFCFAFPLEKVEYGL